VSMHEVAMKITGKNYDLICKSGKIKVMKSVYE